MKRDRIVVRREFGPTIGWEALPALGTPRRRTRAWWIILPALTLAWAAVVALAFVVLG